MEKNNQIVEKIIKLEAENVKRLKVIEISPSGEVVTIAGDNSQGKSSTLDAILMALAGKKYQTLKPVREGSDSAKIRLELSTLVVEKEIRPDGKETLTVTDKEGTRFTSPQRILDSLYEHVGFDPLSFAMQSPKDQVATIKKITGLDLTTLDEKRKSIYERRAEVNKEVKKLDVELSQLVIDDSLPRNISSPEHIIKAIHQTNQKVSQYHLIEQEHRQATIEYRTILEQIKSLESRLEEVKERGEKAKTKLVSMGERPSVEGYQQQLIDLESHNEKIRANNAAIKKRELKITKASESDLMTREIEKIDTEKSRLLKEAKMPIVGLTFDDQGVYYDGIPLASLGTGDQIKVCCSVAIALNPILRVILIRQGSLLDAANFQVVKEMMEKHNCQAWIEVVGKKDDRASVVIEDGSVVE